LGRALLGVLQAFPAAARRHSRAALLATAVLAAGTTWGYFQVRDDPTAAAILLSSALQSNAESFRNAESGRTGDPVYGAFYFTNNARVAFNAFALGATFGVGTIAVVLVNGVLLGATAAIVAANGSLRAFLSFVLPHAGVELTAIVLAAAAGLHLGAAILAPGWRRRTDSLAVAARDSLPLVLGCAALLVIAGVVEGFISPMSWPLRAKAAIGGTLNVLLVFYLFSTRSGNRQEAGRD
jgi:uncharacterized membrane protein SpoIIM required for sporulation